MGKNQNKKQPAQAQTKTTLEKTLQNTAVPNIHATKTQPRKLNPYLEAEIKSHSIDSLPQNGAWMPKFLTALARGWPPTLAAKSAFVSRTAAYEYAKRNPEFEEAWIRAEKDGLEYMEGILRKRAESASDYALMAFIKARDERYREKVHFEIVRKYIGDFAVQVTHILRNTIPETCPHCKTNLGLSLKVAEALRELSAQIGEKS